MGIFSRRRKNRVRNSNRRRPLRAEPLEDRRMLTAIAAPLPCSVVLLNPTVTNVLPPDPSIQFSPQPLVSAAASGAVVHWQGHFSESVVESPSAAVSGRPGGLARSTRSTVSTGSRFPAPPARRARHSSSAARPRKP